MRFHHTPFRVAFQRPWPTTGRGFVLWLFCLGFIVLGSINYIGTTIPQPTRTYLDSAIAFAGLFGLGPWIYGVIFLVVGLFCGWTSYCHRGTDEIGYRIAAAWAAAWGLVYVTGLFHGASIRTLGAATLWLLFAAILTACARFIPFQPWTCPAPDDPEGKVV